jgi:hypothetical protein
MPLLSRSIRPVLAALILLTPALLGACAASPGPDGSSDAAATPLPESRPADFTLGLTVYTPDIPVRRPGQRAARYTVSPDGWLRTAIGQGATASTHPPIARLLTPDQRDEIWSLLRAANPESVSPALTLPSPATFDTPSGRRVYLIEIHAQGRRTTLAMPEGEPETEPFITLADQLAAWSWIHP